MNQFPNIPIPNILSNSIYMASNFNSRILEITVISAENLQIHGKFIKTHSFVNVKSDSHNSQTTKIDHNNNGGSFPSWNEKLVLDLPMYAKFMTVEVHSRISDRKSKIVGSVNVPVEDFTSGYVPESYRQFLSYRLRDNKGERNGIINLSVKVKVAGENGISMPEKMGTGVPMLLPERKLGCGGGGVIVTGIPVWSIGYPTRL